MKNKIEILIIKIEIIFYRIILILFYPLFKLAHKKLDKVFYDYYKDYISNNYN